MDIIGTGILLAIGFAIGWLLLEICIALVLLIGAWIIVHWRIVFGATCFMLLLGYTTAVFLGG